MSPLPNTPEGLVPTSVMTMTSSPAVQSSLSMSWPQRECVEALGHLTFQMSTQLLPPQPIVPPRAWTLAGATTQASVRSTAIVVRPNRILVLIARSSSGSAGRDALHRQLPDLLPHCRAHLGRVPVVHAVVDAGLRDLGHEFVRAAPGAHDAASRRARRAEGRRSATADLRREHRAERSRDDAVRARILGMHGRLDEREPARVARGRIVAVAAV